jgi:lipopolysaccharide/colanic/teichoic acid biosynthesis glycosyltransferase
VALYLRDVEIFTKPDWTVIGYYWVAAAGFAVLAFYSFRLRDGMTRNFSVQEAIDIVEAVLFTELMTCALLFTLTRLDGIPRSTPLIHGMLLAAGLIAARIYVRIVFADDEDDETLSFQNRREHIILIGTNRFATSFLELLTAYSPRKQPVIAVLDENSKAIGRAIAGVQVLATPLELDAVVSEFAVHGVNTHRVIIAGESDFLSPAALHAVENVCKKRKISLSFLPRMLGLTEWKQPEIVATAQETPLRPSFVRLKRFIDIVGSLTLMVLLLPLLAIVSVLVLLDVGPPVFFWQERVGWKGRSFLIYKFRTLGAPFDSVGNSTFVNRKPSAIGRLLRASRIDELPQLLNVLFGDMSLIGPRPLLPEDQPPNSAIRLLVRPGISGWAQVNGAKLVSKDEKEKLDEWYVRNASLAVDFRIALMTLKVMLKSRMSPEETSIDEEQVQSRDVDFKQTSAVRSRVAGESRH